MCADSHPLDPLTPEEIEIAVRAIRANCDVDDRARFVEVELLEPAARDAAPERKAFVVVLDMRDGKVYEGRVLLGREAVEDWRHIDGAQTPIIADDFRDSEEVVKADPAFRRAIAARGLDLEEVIVDTWSLGDFIEPGEEGRRLAKAIAWVRRGDHDNEYARPIGGLVAVVDLLQRSVVRIEDHGEVPLPPEPGNYRASDAAELRQDLRRLEIVQADGPSFTLDGHLLRWQKWRIRIGFNRREGLVLHDIAYEDQGRLRPIVDRASYVEMVVPYGDPSPNTYFKNAFDIGEHGIGELANSLRRGCDCLGHIEYLDAHLADSHGEVRLYPNAVCIHEEDDGVLWKHYDARTDTSEVRRSRRLVVSMFCTVANYEYGFYWYFRQDGSIEAEAKLTGIMHTAAVEPGEQPRHGRLVAPQLNAPIHQHFFTVRLDMAVDGPANAVYEVETRTSPRGPLNPYGTAFEVDETLLRREGAGAGTVSTERARHWRIVNQNVRNRLGQPVGFELLPGENAFPFARADSSFVRRAQFLRRHLWVTPTSPSERFPAGDYPNQSSGDDGVATWSLQRRSIVDTRVTLWYTFCAHHVPRTEDWPVMPVVRVGFMLRPNGFFERNPALDVPPPMHCH